MCHISCVTCDLSCVTFHVSHVMFFCHCQICIIGHDHQAPFQVVVLVVHVLVVLISSGGWEAIVWPREGVGWPREGV